MEMLLSSSNIKNINRRVLVVEDEQINREILGAILGRDYDVDYAADGKEAWEKLHADCVNYSLILLDLMMPVMSGYELLEKISSDPAVKAIPVIVMTSEKDAEVKSIRQGAVDFISKPYDMPEVILARCERIIKLYEDRAMIKLTENDELTGLYSRDFFFEYVKWFDAYSLREGKTVDAIVFNIEHFHLINEMCGRSIGDSVLKELASCIQSVFSSSDFIAGRPGGDTFYVYCLNSDANTSCIKKVQWQMANFRDDLKIRVRAGIYQNVDFKVEPEGRFDRAKLACNRISGDYTATVAYYDNELHLKSIYNERLIRDVDVALKNGDFKVYYQPKYEITSDRPRLCSAEALIRWQHSELGMINPGVFIPLFEQNGLIQRIDNYVWDRAAAQISEWRKKFGRTVPVSVNVSRIDIFDQLLEVKLQHILKKNGITSKELMLEITESAYADNAEKLIETVNKLRGAGFRIEMDDFGTGYSSLNMITSICFDVLKLDMKFVKNMERDEKSLKLVEIVISIAKFLNVPVVAEGVETESQLGILKSMGCQVIQGFYFSRPVPAEDFEEFIRREEQ